MRLRQNLCLRSFLQIGAPNREYIEGASAIELVYDGNRWVIDEPTKEQSLVKAKLALKAYRAFHGLDGQFWPDYRYATLAPVFAATRDAELRTIAEIDAVRFAPARLQ